MSSDSVLVGILIKTFARFLILKDLLIFVTISKMVDECTKKTLSSLPLLQTRAGPRDKDIWVQRLKEEYQALIKVGKAYNSLKFILY